MSDHLEKAGQLNVWHIHRIGDFKHRQHPAVIRWDDNAIRLEYCASNYDIAKSIQYSYRLEGPAEEDWSPYSHRRVTRLIGQIDTNIEHDDDLEAFKDSFDIIHNHFLQTLSERYPSLTHKEKMLCTYIRMNLLSKEIAPLLNISTRGVEISRYRIRQKLNLDTKESLSDFLQRI